jgi:hypothetical protein
MILYFYVDRWLANCIHNFGDDLLPYDSNMTYGQLFFSFLTVEELGTYDKSYTYLFEMCSSKNRVVTKYESDRLFFLGMIHTESANEKTYSQIQDEFKNKMSSNLSIKLPQKYDKLLAFDSSDFLLEGYLGIKELRSDDGANAVFNSASGANGAVRIERTKYKNPYYLIIHRLKYRNFPGMFTHGGLAAMQQNGIKIEQIESHLLDLGLNSSDILEMKHIEKEGRYTTHPAKYCMPATMTTSTVQGAISDDLGSSDRTEKHCICSCGSSMSLRRLKRDYVHPNFCHCGERLDWFKINNGCLIYLCDDPRCTLAHSAQQEDITYPLETMLRKKGEPLGIPCSRECKKWRLHLHQVLEEYIRDKGVNRSAVYDMIAQILDLPRELSHVASLDIKQCHKVINELMNQPNN